MSRMRPAPLLPDGAPTNAILADLATAAVWTGRPEGTLRRWIAENRVTRYGTARSAWLDLRELPEAGTGLGAPPRRDQRHADLRDAG